MKTYIISGAGSGIGRAMAGQLASEGNQIILLGRNQKRLDEVKATLNGENHLVLLQILQIKIRFWLPPIKLKTSPLMGL
jgi:short-subunit dehydrogenase